MAWVPRKEGHVMPTKTYCTNIYTTASGTIKAKKRRGRPRKHPVKGETTEEMIVKKLDYYFAFDTLYSLNYEGNLRWKLGLEDYSGGPLVCDVNGIVYLPVGQDKYLSVSNNGDIVWRLDFFDKSHLLGHSPALGIDQTIYIPTFKYDFVYSIR